MDDKGEVEKAVISTHIWKTKEQYAKCFGRFSELAKARQKKDPVGKALPLAVVMARLFVQSEAQWAAATARFYRAALLWGFKQQEMKGSEQAIAILNHENEDPAVRQQRLQRMQALRRERRIRQPRCSQKKAKRFTREDVKPLIQALCACRSKWGIAAAHYLVATIHTGLRPTEWANATLIVHEGKPALRVVNAKNTHGRSHGKYRTLRLGELLDAELAVIERHLRLLQPYIAGERCLFYYDACRQVIQDVAKRVYPKKRRRPSLYTARHMFAALAKKSFDRAEVAALMGHASINTAGEHYAPSWSARGSSRVKPSQEDVEAVRALNPGGDEPQPDQN